jgi:hypothetical protein
MRCGRHPLIGMVALRRPRQIRALPRLLHGDPEASELGDDPRTKLVMTWRECGV